MRVRRLALCLGAAALLAAPAVTPAAATTTATVPQLRVASTRELPMLRQNPAVEGRDNGQSAGYQGRSVWIFDDTILKDPFDFLSNTGAVTSDLDGSDGIDLLSDNPFVESSQGRPTTLMPLTEAESDFQTAHATPCVAGDEYCGTVFGFWPGPVIADPARHRIIFSYGKLCRGAPDGTLCASGFVGHAIGTGFAELDMRTHQVRRIGVEHPDPGITSPEGADPAMMWPPDATWGSGQLVLRGDTLYAYGACDANNVCGVARVPIDRIQDRLAWRFYTGARADGTPIWGTDPHAAVSVGINDGAAGGTVQYVPALHGYLDTYMAGISGEGWYQTAANPWGPWSAPRKMFTGLPTTTLWDYAMFAHPEYSRNGGLTQYITYYRPQTEAQELVRVDFAVERS
jgi:hypothetical protein